MCRFDFLVTLNVLYRFVFVDFQHVCQVRMVKAACSAAAVLRARPATTSLESAAVLLDLLATAANRVSAVGLTCLLNPLIQLPGHYKLTNAPMNDTDTAGLLESRSIFNALCVSVHSLSACLPGTFGQNCNQVCQCSETNQLCHPVSGLCYCAPGFHGPKCDQGLLTKLHIHPHEHISLLNCVTLVKFWSMLLIFSLRRGSLWSQLWKNVQVWKWREVRSFHRSLWMSSRIYRSKLQHQWVCVKVWWWWWTNNDVSEWQVSGVLWR